MKGLLIAIAFLILGCSSEKPEHKNFPDLTLDEKAELFKQFGEELKGDFLIYVGKVDVKDTPGFRSKPTFIELVMDKDNTFAIRLKTIQSEIITDSTTFSFNNGITNYGTGNWTDLGDKFQLKFKVGTVDSFFNNENNINRLDVLDNYTLRFDKTIDKMWIGQIPCEKLGG